MLLDLVGGCRAGVGAAREVFSAAQCNPGSVFLHCDDADVYAVSFFEDFGLSTVFQLQFRPVQQSHNAAEVNEVTISFDFVHATVERLTDLQARGQTFAVELLDAQADFAVLSIDAHYFEVAAHARFQHILDVCSRMPCHL